MFSTAVTAAKQEPSFIVAGKQELSAVYYFNHSRGKHQRAVEHTIETGNKWGRYRRTSGMRIAIELAEVHNIAVFERTKDYAYQPK